ncbi:type II CAAX prenyl endopeptidase Rce1 family protein, partial [Klebsiella pneumoniae]|uniref:CPBP family glutamic-type intramembrane protease n=1 Tax=Klebsiella pneumoniae TaxID=573 RepID=UPI003A859417
KTEILDFRVLSALVLFLSVPILVGDLSYMTPFARVVYAATSIFVALKEEIAFRALIQNLLARRYGQLTAIVATSALFTCYHIGAVPLTVFAYGQVLIASLILGI